MRKRRRRMMRRRRRKKKNKFCEVEKFHEKKTWHGRKGREKV